MTTQTILQLSQARFLGSVRVLPDGETEGLVQVYDLDLLGGRTPIQVQIAGTIVVETLASGLEGKAQISKMGDIPLRFPTLPKKIPVNGMLKTTSGLQVAFSGTLHPTGYLLTAWENLGNLDAPLGRTQFF